MYNLLCIIFNLNYKPFDDFKIKNQQFFKAIAALDNDEFTKLL